MTTETQAPDPARDLLDDDGENRAVRAFLMLYGAGSPTAAQMAVHMRMSGFDVVPEWVERSPGHLTKGGAQLWLRQLFALEAIPAPEGAEWVGATAFIQHAQNAAGSAGAQGHWADEFLAWYKPDEWFGEHRAAAIFIGTKIAALAAPAPQAAQWQPIETAPENTEREVVVQWIDSDGAICRDLDYREDGCWMGWHNHAEHVEMIGGHGVSYTPPYTNWMPLPPAPKG